MFDLRARCAGQSTPMDRRVRLGHYDLSSVVSERRNDTPRSALAFMSYAIATIVLIALVIGITALNVSHRRHRSRLTKRQTEREDLEHEVECSIW